MNNIKPFASLAVSSKIKSAVLILLAASLVACQGEPSAQTLDSSKYTTLAEPLNVSTGDKIEVVELFWYGCQHCFALEPHVENWKKTMPENAEFVKVPALFSRNWEFHAKAYYTMELLGVLDQANEAFFHQIHIKKKRMNTMDSLVEFLEPYGKTEKEITSTMGGFAVDTKVRNARSITQKSGANGVPAIVVDGKYQSSVSLTGGAPQLFDVVDQLVEKAAAER